MGSDTTHRLPLLSFLAIAFAIATPAFALYGSGAQPALQPIFLILGSCAPALAAVLVARFSGDRDSLRYRLTLWKVQAIWYFASVFLPSMTWLVSAVAVSAFDVPVRLAATSLAAFPLIFLTNFVEEVGWRGFALPRLLARQSPLAASILLGFMWIVFHAPLYWQRPLEGLLFLAPIAPISIIITWLFLGTRGSVPVCTLFHAVFNTWALALLETSAIQPLLLAETAVLLVVAAILAIRLRTSATSARSEARPAL
jgi:membrane protease YdiL (CAAX protease family)